MQFWFLLGLNALLHTGHSNSCGLLDECVPMVDVREELRLGKGDGSGEKDARSDITEGERDKGHLYSSSIISNILALAVAGVGLLNGDEGRIDRQDVET